MTAVPFDALSAAVGLAVRTRRSDAPATILAGLRAARDEHGIRGSANERDAEQILQTRIGPGSGSDPARGPIRLLGLEATIDVARDTLDEIATERSPV